MLKPLLVLFFGLSASLLHAHGECSGTDLHGYMEDIKTELKSLSFEVKKERFDEASIRVQKIRKLVSMSAEEQPFLFREESLQGQELEEMQGKYNQAMTELANTFAQIDEALAEKDSAKAADYLRDVGKLRKLGHRTFQGDC